MKNLDAIIWLFVCVFVSIAGLYKIAPFVDRLGNWAINTNNQLTGALILFVGFHLFAISIMFVCAFFIGLLFNHRTA